MFYIQWDHHLNCWVHCNPHPNCIQWNCWQFCCWFYLFCLWWTSFLLAKRWLNRNLLRGCFDQLSSNHFGRIWWCYLCNWLLLPIWILHKQLWKSFFHHYILLFQTILRLSWENRLIIRFFSLLWYLQTNSLNNRTHLVDIFFDKTSIHLHLSKYQIELKEKWKSRETSFSFFFFLILCFFFDWEGFIK